MKKSVFKFWEKGNFYFFVAGMLALILLLDNRIGIYDWGKEIAYFNLIKTSLSQYHSLPFYWWNPQGYADYPAVSVSSFFLGNPETFAFSPFVLFLFVLDTIVFMKLLYVLFLVLAIFGIQKLGKKLNWKANQQRIFAALFLFSPIIVQHIAIGYIPWLNLFLFPWLLLFLLEEKPIFSIFGTAGVLSLVLLQGGLHPFVWFTGFVGIFFLVQFLQKPAIRTIFLFFGIIALIILLSFVRLNTSMQIFADFQQRIFNGYRPSGFINWGLTPPLFTPADMDDIEPYIESYDNGVPYWDGAIYWGGVLPLAIPALVVMINKKFKCRSKGIGERQSLIFSIGISALVMTLLSIGNLYRDMIIPVSDFLRLPALQGMERFPFRFALLGYYGSSFIVANYFDDILFLIMKILSVLKRLFRKLNHFVLRISRKNYQQKFLLFVIVISILYTISALSKQIFLIWFTEIARKAYEGQSYPWLASLMSQRAIIPFSIYLSKINAFYSNLQGLVLRITIVGWFILLFIFFNSQMKIAVAHFDKFLKKRTPIIIELCLVLPLLFASMMWMRVALATPIKEKIQFSFVPPEVQIIPSSSGSSIGYSVSPTSLKLDVKEYAPPQKIIFSNIKFSDNKFLQTSNLKDQWFDQEGWLGLIPAEKGDVDIRIDPNSYQPALHITIISWLAMLLTWFSYDRWLNKPGLSKIKFNTQRRMIK